MASDDAVAILPDGSGFFTMEWELPGNHWLYDDCGEPPTPMLMGTDNPERKRLAAALYAAGKYALRASTDSGKMDYDPDSVLQNLVVGMLGYHTFDGISHAVLEPAEVELNR